jgi:hypothetical protein
MIARRQVPSDRVAIIETRLRRVFPVPRKCLAHPAALVSGVNAHLFVVEERFSQDAAVSFG